MTNKFLSTSSDIETTIIKCPLILTPETPLIEAIQLMSQVRDSCDLTLAIAQSDVNLLNQLEKSSCILAYKDNKLVGIFTQRDIVKSTAMGLNLESATLTDVMNKNPVTLKKSEFTNIFVVLNWFHQHKIRHLVIVDDQDNLIGFVTPTTIRQLLQAADLLKIRTIGNVMTSEVIQAPSTTSVLYSFDPLDMYDTVNFLQNKIYQLESEKIEILEKQNTELETQVQERTSKLIEPANVNKLLAILSEKIRNSLDIEYILQTTVSEIQFYQQAQQELWERQQAEINLKQKQLNKELESRVAQRTTELEQINHELLLEIQRRTQVEKILKNQLAAIEATIDGIAILRDNKFIFLNKAHIQMFGYDTVEELIGKYWTELYKLEEIARIEQKVFPILGETGYWRGEAIAKRRDGSTFNEEVSLTITHDGELICVCRDITEGKKAQAKLQESEQKFRQLAENLHQVFWISDPKTSQIIYISPAYEEIWGLSCASLYENPKSFIDSIYPDDLQEFMMVMQNKKNGFYIEYRIKRPDGSIRWIHDRCFPLKDATGQVYRIVGIAEDITQRKQVETEIQKALAKEKELSELKSRFVSMTSHEFRTPLTVISSSAEILKNFGHGLDEKCKIEHLECIETYVEHTIKLLDDILLINKAETGNLAFEPAPLDLVPFCQLLTQEIQLSASNHIIVFSNNFQSNVIGNFDKKILRQILSNLLSNAIKYSPNSAIVNFNLDITESIVIFSIQDQGIGIPEADQVKLFESFHRAENVGNIPGTGLGLSIVAKCVDLHKGAIAVNSQLGRGTTFIVKIPLNISQL